MAWLKETRGNAGYIDFSSGYLTGPAAALKRGMIAGLVLALALMW
jgi:hypothetical protein